ncbi:MAG: mechanosensitive ion channel family protein [Acidobacteriota bacterium]|nr:mechanosensitive ion channel family protein [Acidobacteriota bacterium]
MQASPATATLPHNSLEVLLALAMAALVATAFAMLAGALTRRLLMSIEGERFHTRSIADRTVSVVRRLTFAITLLALVFPALDFAGVDIAVGLRDEDLAQWAARTGVRVLLLLLLAFAANRFAGSVIRRAEHEIVQTGETQGFERRKRAHTLGAASRRFVSSLIWITAALVILRELDVDITPVLTGAGILGLAVGFGAQTLVKDMIAGIFIIAEDQVRVGDSAIVNGIEGAVEEINLRTIVLRNGEGVVYTIANGDIRTLANRSKDFGYAVITLEVSYHDDTDAIVEAVKAAGDELARDPSMASSLLAPLEVLGIDDFAAGQVTLRFRIKTLPVRRDEAGRELRRLIKKTLDGRGIKLFDVRRADL